MDLMAVLRQLVRDMMKVDRSQIDVVRAFRNAIGVVAPLAIGAATGHVLTGFGVSIGALNVSFSDLGGPYRLRAFRMVMASVFGGVSVFIGAATATVEPVAVILVALWGFGGGMLMALGAAAGQLGLTGIILLLVYSGYPAPLDHAASQALLVLGGGLLQTVLAVGAWPARQHGPERDVLATAFQHLAELAREPADPNTAPPMTGAITTASTTLSGFGRDHSAAGEAFRVLLDEAERIRLELVSLNAIQADTATSAQTQTVRNCAGVVLEAVADLLAGREPSSEWAEAMRRIDTIIKHRREEYAERDGEQRATADRSLMHLEALAGQLRAVLELAVDGGESERVGTARSGVSLRTTIRGSLEILRANMNIHATAFRHAVRLAACLTIASFLARRLGVSRVYWVPLTAAIVLRPDFAATFTRGLGRIAGTMVGLVLATGLVFTPLWNLPGRILLVGLFVFAIRALGPANFALAAAGVSAMVAILLSFAGTPPDTTASIRALDTLLGGGVALTIYLVWPTWERSQTPAIVATMLETYCNYFDAVMAGYLHPQRLDGGTISSTRLASRLARSNAESSLERARNEPVGRGEQVDRLDGLLANSHRFAQSALALESGLYREPKSALPPKAERFVHDVDRTIDALARTIRDPANRLDRLPDLRADRNALLDGNTLQDAGTFAAETERITNSLNTMAHVLRSDAEPREVDPPG